MAPVSVFMAPDSTIRGTCFRWQVDPKSTPMVVIGPAPFQMPGFFQTIQ
jgi:hypothetical protein